MKSRKKIFFAVVVAMAVCLLAAGVFLTKKKEQMAERTAVKKEEEESVPEYVEVERLDAPYEYWLAAAAITCISMNEPDFSEDRIYIAGETENGKRMESQGIYVTYQSEGEAKCVQVKPIEEARTEAGTKDLYSEMTGYASYEETEETAINRDVFHVVEIEDMNTLIGQSEKVTLYGN